MLIIQKNKMIRLDDKLNLEGYGLLLLNNKLTITKTIKNEYILIDKSIELNVMDNVDVNILDISSNKEITVNISKNANVNYQIIKSNSTNRKFINNGNLDITEICLNGTKSNLNIDLVKEEANSNVSVLAITNEQKQEFIQYVSHNSPKTYSNISNFGVALNKSTITFDTSGKILKGMAKSKCVQLSKGIIMDDNAKITSKPILLIDEFDVVANHGASIGKMSDDSLFYLMSRGLTKKEAFLLVLNGIINPFITKIFDEELKQSIINELSLLIKE